MKKYSDIVLRLIFSFSIVLLTEIRTTQADDTALDSGQIIINYASENNVSLFASKVQRINILKELARYIKIELYTYHQFDDEISIEIDQQSLNSVFAKVLGEKNFLLRYGSTLVREDQRSKLKFYQFQPASGEGYSNCPSLNKQADLPPNEIYNYAQIIEKIENFGDFENPNSVQQLEELINSHNVTQRLTIAESLGDIGSANAVNLLKKLITDPSPNVREAAIYALGDIGSPDAVQILGLAINNEIPDIRELAISELALINNNQSVENLMKFFHQQDTDLQIKLLRAIAGINTSTAREHLWEVLESENPQISMTAYELLNQTR